MNKKEIAEIKKTLRSNSGCVSRIVGYYINADKQSIQLSEISTGLLREDETEEYMKIAKKIFTGGIGSSIHTLAYKNDAENEDGAQNNLYLLYKSQLKDEKMMEKLKDRIIENYSSEQEYFILFYYATYDVPRKNSNCENDGDSEEVFHYMLCCICPAKLSKASLFYSMTEQKLQENLPIRTVTNPSFGFMFPAFNDRSADIHSILTYTKKSTDIDTSMYENVLGCAVPTSKETQKESFEQLTNAAFNEECGFNEVRDLQLSLFDYMTSSSEMNPLEPVTIDRTAMTSVMEENYAPNVEKFNERYQEILGDSEIQIDNIVPKKAVIKTPDFTITGPMDALHLVSVKDIDNMKVLIVNPNGGNISINGLSTQEG